MASFYFSPLALTPESTEITAYVDHKQPQPARRTIGLQLTAFEHRDSPLDILVDHLRVDLHLDNNAKSVEDAEGDSNTGIMAHFAEPEPVEPASEEGSEFQLRTPVVTAAEVKRFKHLNKDKLIINKAFGTSLCRLTCRPSPVFSSSAAASKALKPVPPVSGSKDTQASVRAWLATLLITSSSSGNSPTTGTELHHGSFATRHVDSTPTAVTTDIACSTTSRTTSDISVPSSSHLTPLTSSSFSSPALTDSTAPTTPRRLVEDVKAWWA
ncbi:hypothetical protein JCM11641_006454 [Rhodosporidiobolus odoratus]